MLRLIFDRGEAKIYDRFTKDLTSLNAKHLLPSKNQLPHSQIPNNYQLSIINSPLNSLPRILHLFP